VIYNYTLILGVASGNYLMIMLGDGTIIDSHTVVLGILAGLIFVATISYVLHFGHDSHPVALGVFASLIFIAVIANFIYFGND